jgi:hypothetical protein
MTNSKRTLFGIFVILVLSIVVFRWYEFFAGAAVRQPLKFSHKVHAEQAKCEDCHTSVEKTASAGIPDINVCMGCHQGGPVTDSPEEKKLMNYIDNKKDISWERLYKAPVHVYFSHGRHVSVAKLSCEKCHGDIGKTAKPPGRALVKIEMSYCTSCHNRNKIDTSCVTCHR